MRWPRRRTVARRFRLAADEAWLNQHPAYAYEVDGERLHVIHAQSPEADVLPLVMLHGWPSAGE